MKAETRRDNDVSIFVAVQASPQRLNDGFRTRRRPHDRVESFAKRRCLYAFQKSVNGQSLDFGDGVISGQRNKFVVTISARKCLRGPVEIAEKSFRPALRIVPEIRDEDSLAVVVKFATVGGVMKHAR